MRNWSFPIGRLAGIPLRLHLTFLILPPLFAYQGWASVGPVGMVAALGLLAGMFGSIVLHELAHSLVAQRCGVVVGRIVLLPIGGVAEFDRIPRDPLQELAITAAGPAVNFILALAGFLLVGFAWPGLAAAVPTDGVGLVRALAAWNLAMGLFNLLPVFPMDGGRIVRALLSLRFSYLSATRWSAHFGKVAAVACAIYFTVEFGSILPAFLFAVIFIGGDLEYQAVKRREELAGIYIGDVMRRRFLHLPAEASLADAVSLLTRHRPQDVIITQGERAIGILPLDRLRTAWRAEQRSDRVSWHVRRPAAILQAEWPLETFHRTIAQSPDAILPVYSGGRLVGVVETRQLEDSVRWLLLSRLGGG